MSNELSRTTYALFQGARLCTDKIRWTVVLRTNLSLLCEQVWKCGSHRGKMAEAPFRPLCGRLMAWDAAVVRGGGRVQMSGDVRGRWQNEAWTLDDAGAFSRVARARFNCCQPNSPMQPSAATLKDTRLLLSLSQGLSLFRATMPPAKARPHDPDARSDASAKEKHPTTSHTSHARGRRAGGGAALTNGSHLKEVISASADATSSANRNGGQPAHTGSSGGVSRAPSPTRLPAPCDASTC